MKKIFFIYSTIISIVLISTLFFIKKTYIYPKQSGKVAIIATIFPLYDFARNVGGDKVTVELLLPPSTEVHNYEPTPRDVIRINACDVFIYTGLLMEPWVENIVAGIKNKITLVVNTSSKIPLMKECNCVNTKTNSPDHRHHNEYDPHIWLDFDNAKNIVNTIAKVLKERDPSNASYYEANAINYNKELTKLDNLYKERLSKSKTKQIIHGGHYSFGYLAKRYNLKYTAAQGFSPDGELTAQDIITLLKQIKKHGIKYLFYEELENAKIAEIIASETGAKLLVLNSAHNLSKRDYESDVTYISLMKKNLQSLSIGLNCANNENNS